MKMNAKKTKAMVISTNGNKPTFNIKVDGTAVEQIGSFNYLGQTVSADERYVDEIKKRIEIAKKIRHFEISKDTIEYEKESLAMFCLVNTVVWCREMDHNQSNEDTSRSI